MSEINLSVAEAKEDKLFYVVANIVIVNAQDKTCLLLKRSENEKVLPGKWAFPGGKLEHKDVNTLLTESGNAPIDGIDNILGKLAVRESKEECNLDVDGDSATVIKNKVFVRPDGVPVFMTTLAGLYTGGEVVLEAESFTDYAWVTEEQLVTYDTLDGVKKEASLALSLYSKA